MACRSGDIRLSSSLQGTPSQYFNWWKKKGCILADEMGLGKTVQIISFISVLFKQEGALPFMIVVCQQEQPGHRYRELNVLLDLRYRTPLSRIGKENSRSGLPAIYV